MPAFLRNLNKKKESSCWSFCLYFFFFLFTFFLWYLEAGKRGCRSYCLYFSFPCSPPFSFLFPHAKPHRDPSPVARRPDAFWFVREEIIVKIPCGLIFDEITLPGSVDSPDDTAKVEYFVAVGPAAMFASRWRHFADGFFQPVGGGKRGERRRGRLSRLFCKVKCINSDERLRPWKPLCRNVQ